MSEEYKSFIETHLGEIRHFSSFEHPTTRKKLNRKQAVSYLSRVWRKQKEIQKNIEVDPKYYKYIVRYNDKTHILYDREKVTKLFIKYAKQIGMYSDDVLKYLYYMLLEHKDGAGYVLIKDQSDKKQSVGMQFASKKNNIYEALGMPFEARKK
jgi:hypothetical protein